MTRKKQHAESGVVLVIALVMLLMMTIMAVVSYKIGTSSLQIVGNMRANNDAVVAATSTIEEVLSTARLFENPGAVFLTPCTVANTKCFDLNSDGTTDITVTLTPQPVCVQAQRIPNKSLDLSVADDAACATGAAQTFGVEGTATGDSICGDSLWEITAVAVDAVTGARSVIKQGAAVRVSTDSIDTSCP